MIVWFGLCQNKYSCGIYLVSCQLHKVMQLRKSLLVWSMSRSTVRNVLLGLLCPLCVVWISVFWLESTRLRTHRGSYEEIPRYVSARNFCRKSVWILPTPLLLLFFTLYTSPLPLKKKIASFPHVRHTSPGQTFSHTRGDGKYDAIRRSTFTHLVCVSDMKQSCL